MKVPLPKDVRDGLAAAAETALKTYEPGVECSLCKEPWKWAVSGSDGKAVLVCERCGEVLFNTLADRLQGKQAMKVIVQNRNRDTGGHAP